MFEIKKVWSGPMELGESPVWDDRENKLYFVDNLGGIIWRCAADGSDVQSWAANCKIGSMVLRKQTGALLATDAGFQFFDFDSGQRCQVATLHQSPGLILNDGKVDPFGDFICGDVDTSLWTPEGKDAAPRGKLYRLDSELEVHEIGSGIGCTNGPCWSPDGSTFYLADSWTCDIHAFNWRPNITALGVGRPIASIKDGSVPDGATVDEEGFIWTTLCLGGSLRRYSPDGVLDRTIEMPVKGVSSVAFGGADIDVLFVTSLAGSVLGDRPDPAGGALFAVSGLGVRGLPSERFNG